MHKNIFGWVYCIDILIRILMKFILHFFEISIISYVFIMLKEFLEYINE
jgi:hypothetical protein